jgi:hypothetical protein
VYIATKPAPQSAARRANRTNRGGKSFSSMGSKCPKSPFEAMVREYWIRPPHPLAKNAQTGPETWPDRKRQPVRCRTALQSFALRSCSAPMQRGGSSPIDNEKPRTWQAGLLRCFCLKARCVNSSSQARPLRYNSNVLIPLCSHRTDTRLLTIANTLLFTALLCLWSPLRALGQQQKDSTWQDKQGHVRSRSDLDKILDAHKQWVESGGGVGARADLSGINLSYAELDGVNLWGANFEGTILIGAKLKGAILGPLGQKNQQKSTVLGGWRLSPPILLSLTVCCDENGQPTMTSHSPVTDLRRALLNEADLSGADVRYADLPGAALAPSRCKSDVADERQIGRAVWSRVSA